MARDVFFYGFSDSAIIPKLITVDVITAVVTEVENKCATFKKKTLHVNDGSPLNLIVKIKLLG